MFNGCLCRCTGVIRRDWNGWKTNGTIYKGNSGRYSDCSGISFGKLYIWPDGSKRRACVVGGDLDFDDESYLCGTICGVAAYGGRRGMA